MIYTPKKRKVFFMNCHYTFIQVELICKNEKNMIEQAMITLQEMAVFNSLYGSKVELL